MNNTQKQPFELAKLSSLFVLLFLAFCLWQSPGLIQGKLSEAEIDNYLASASKLYFPSDAEKAHTLARIKAWAMQDDGKPFHMLNLMRYQEQLQHVPGFSFAGTPKEANAHYEDLAMPMLITAGGLGGSFAGQSQGANLISIGTNPELDHWDRVLVVRYPSRRHFMQLISNPDYADIEPLKLMSMQTVLVPLESEMVIPDYRLMVGGLLSLAFLAIGWQRASRKVKSLA